MDIEYIDDPKTGVKYLRMASWSSVGFTPTDAAIAEAEAREGIKFQGPKPKRTEAQRIADLETTVDTLLMWSL